ncbi:MAG: carbohydrate ABC transporter permease [Clostridia bacterium]|nr:carbohydrate ABC transporter permease [Clostridia bacterium]
MLGSFSYRLSPVFWCLLPTAVISLLCTLKLRFGQIRQPLLRLILYVSVLAFSLFILYPFFVMFITAFRSNAETTDMYFLHILPTKWIWSNLRDTLERGVLRYLINSLMIAGGATVISMLCAIPAAYAMARMNFRIKKAYLGFVIMSQMFSPVVLLVGISRLMNTLHLNDSLIGLMFINAAFNQAFAIWLLRGTFVSISSEMEQAAFIDGCSTLSALLRILIPIASPGIVTTLIFVFINSWNEYTVSTVLISTQTNRPITVGITQFSSFNMIEWQYLFAAALLATVPVVILFMLIEKHLAAGLTSGGVKG